MVYALNELKGQKWREEEVIGVEKLKLRGSSPPRHMCHSVAVQMERKAGQGADTCMERGLI